MRSFVPVLLTVVMVFAGGSIAYACSGGGGCGDGSGGRDGGQGQGCLSPGIAWENPSGVSKPASVSCSLHLTPTLLTVTVGGLVPGESCAFNAYLINIGTATEYLLDSPSVAEPLHCSQFGYSDNVPYSPAHTLTPNQVYKFQGTIGLGPTAGNPCQGKTATVYVDISVKCTDPDKDGDCDK